MISAPRNGPIKWLTTKMRIRPNEATSVRREAGMNQSTACMSDRLGWLNATVRLRMRNASTGSAQEMKIR